MYIVGVFFNSQKLLKPKLRKINKLRKFFESAICLPAIGGPYMEEVPRARVRIPKALVSFSRPIRSQIMMEVKDI